MVYHIKHNVLFHCSANKVYNAISTPEGIQGWWTVDTIIVPEVGGMAEFIFGEKYHNKMEITDLQPDKRVAWHCVEGDQEWIGTDFTFELEGKDDHTLLRFGHNNWKSQTDFFAHCNFQWGRYMISLKKYCETGSGDPFNPHVNKL